MTSLADIIERGLSPLTDQQLADLALHADQQHRAAVRRRDWQGAAEHAKECARLCRILNGAK